MSCILARVTTEPGKSTTAYCAFVEHVLNTYDAIANPALRRTLIHDNLDGAADAARQGRLGEEICCLSGEGERRPKVGRPNLSMVFFSVCGGHSSDSHLSK